MRVSNKHIDRVYINSCVHNSSFKFNMPENHYHLYYELFYVKNSLCRMFSNNSFYDLKAGDFMLIPPKDLHYTRYPSDAPCTRINIYFKHSDLVDNQFLGEDIFKKYFKTSVVYHVPEMYQNKISELFKEMISEDKIDDGASNCILQLQLKQLFLFFSRYCTLSENALSHIHTQDEQILAAARFISENYQKPLSLESIANISGFSPTYFSKKFKTTTGIGVKEYIIFVRLKHAALELLSTGSSITEVAMNCGFSNSSHFKDAFKKMYELSPREYRKASNAIIPMS